MKAYVFALASIVAGCGGASASKPTFDETQAAVLAHARCIDESVKGLDVRAGTREEQVRAVRGECASLRDEALRLNAVPVFEDTLEQYDAMQDDLADALISTKVDEVEK